MQVLEGPKGLEGLKGFKVLKAAPQSVVLSVVWIFSSMVRPPPVLCLLLIVDVRGDDSFRLVLVRVMVISISSLARDGLGQQADLEGPEGLKGSV